MKGRIMAMNKYKVLLFVLPFVLVLMVYYVLLNRDHDESVIKFFPIDEKLQIIDPITNLSLLYQDDQDEYEIQWETSSKVDRPVYLRQDVSLLYVDGKLKGVLSKWKENGQNMLQKTKVHGEDSSHFQAITFHHGEIHYPDDQIKSIQDMSTAELYVIDSPLTALESFVEPASKEQQNWKHTLDHATNQNLLYHWNELMHYYQIPKEKYVAIPLTALPQYNKKPFPSLSQEKTQEVIGQLWEGLYKNYILGITGHQNQIQPVQSFVPLILVGKDGSHLFVLYEDASGHKQQLIQYIPTIS